MSSIWIIARKELKSLVYSPIAYIVAFFILLIFGLYFYSIPIQHGVAVLHPVFGTLSFFILFLAPLMTMKLVSEEKKKGTIELLLTMPVKPKDIILGKYLAILIIYLGIIAITLIHTLVLFINGNPELGVTLSIYLGVILQGMALLSLGLLMSTLTDSQVIAAVFSLLIGLLMMIVYMLSARMPAPWSDIFAEISFIKHLTSFFRGVVDLKDVAFFLLFTVMGLALSISYLENEKWRK
jgi:ABC-2 type transport system permease protein